MSEKDIIIPTHTRNKSNRAKDQYACHSVLTVHYLLTILTLEDSVCMGFIVMLKDKSRDYSIQNNPIKES